MDTKQKNTIRLGAFVLSASLVFILAIYLVGSNKNIFGSNFLVKSFFTNTAGLQVGNNVRFAGVNVGTIDQITIINDSTIEVDMRLKKEMQSYIRKNAMVSIGVDGIVGSALINITPQNGHAAQIEKGDYLAVSQHTEVSDIINSFGETSTTVSELSKALLTASLDINNGNGTISTLLRDSAMAQNLRHMIYNLQKTSQLILQISSNLNHSTQRMNEGQGNVQRLLYDSSMVVGLENIVNRLDEQLSPILLSKIDTIVDNITIASNNIANVSDQLAQLTDQWQSAPGTIQALLTDTLMAEDLRITLSNLRQGTAKFDEDMKALQQNFLFRRYFKKQEKLNRADVE